MEFYRAIISAYTTYLYLYIEMRLYVADVQHGVRRDTVQFEIVAGRLENTKSAQFIHQADRKVKLVVFEHSECKYSTVYM